MRHRIVALAVVAALGGCGDEPEESREPVVVPAPIALLSESTPIDESNTAPSSTGASTSMSATPVVGEDSATIAGPANAVLAAVGRAEIAYLTALRNPQVDGVSAIEATTAEGSPARDELIGRYRSRLAAGFVLGPNATIPFSITIEGEVELIRKDLASITVCLVDSDVLLRRSANAEGEEQRIVVDDTIDTGRFREEFVAEAGVWRLASRTLIAVVEGAEPCANVA